LLAWSYRRLVTRNLDVALGGGVSEDQKQKIGRESFARLISNILAGVKLGQMDFDSLSKRVTVEGESHLKEALKNGRGIVMVLSHLGNWELLAQIVPKILGCPCGTVYQTLRNPLIDKAMRMQRARRGLALFARRDGFFGAIELLRKGGAVGVLVDQHAGDSGIWASLFGRLASCSPLAATMALRADAVLLPAAMYTDGVGRWRMVIGSPVAPVSRAVEQVTGQINRILEGQILRAPADWLWAHNRWKTPRPKFLLSGSKRGWFTEGMTQKFRVVVRSTNWLGDAVMTIPAIRAMKRARPDLELTVLTAAKLEGLWRNVPEVDRVVCILDKSPILGTAAELRKGKYDAAVVFPNSLRSALEVWLARIPRRVGYAGHARSWLLNQVLERESPRPGKPQHQSYDYLRLAEFVGAPSVPEHEWVSSGRGKASVRKRGELHIGVCPGAEYGGAKRWFPERFAEVMREVATSFPAQWHLFGVSKDLPICEKIEHLFGGKAVNNWAGRTSLVELIDRLSRCDVLLTNDTGTMHLAAQLGVPVVAIFGSTDPDLTGPLGNQHRVIRHRVPCGPCFLRECPIDFTCMRQVSSQEVVAAIKSVLLDLHEHEKGSAEGGACSSITLP
jgi:lipopolysaccharide heptosyltransferase II